MVLPVLPLVFCRAIEDAVAPGASLQGLFLGGDAGADEAAAPVEVGAGQQGLVIHHAVIGIQSEIHSTEIIITKL